MTDALKKWIHEQFYDKEVAHESYSAEDLLRAFVDEVEKRASRRKLRRNAIEYSFCELKSELFNETPSRVSGEQGKITKENYEESRTT